MTTNFLSNNKDKEPRLLSSYQKKKCLWRLCYFLLDYNCSSNDEVENASPDPLERQLHPFTHMSIKETTSQFLQLIRRSQISKKESENLLCLIRSILPFPNQMPKDMNTLLEQIGVTDYFSKRTICTLCEKE